MCIKKKAKNESTIMNAMQNYDQNNTLLIFLFSREMFCFYKNIIF